MIIWIQYTEINKENNMKLVNEVGKKTGNAYEV